MPITTKIDLLKKRRTRIVATIGPASRTSAMIGELLETGVEVFRLNMSHGEREHHRAACHAIRAEADRRGDTVAILADLCGPKIRTGTFRGGEIRLKEGERVTVAVADRADEPGGPGVIPSLYPELCADVRSGDKIMLRDGQVELHVDEVAADAAVCTVVRGGELRDYSGINLPGVKISASCLTPKDREDARFALELGVDFLGLSFVRCAEDVQGLRELVRACSSEAAIIAKFERASALEAVDDILDSADGAMVARGDLGVELPAEQVPIVQHELIRRARLRYKPVIVATQMLESMIHSARPTRAEVTDVAHAVNDGADAVMLSGETAIGRHPIAAVRIMDRVVRQTESYLWRKGATDSLFSPRGGGADVAIDAALLGHAIAGSVASLAQELSVRAIVVLSRSGMSAATMSAARPAAPIIAVAGNENARSLMLLHWGVIPLLADVDAEDPNRLARRVVIEQGLGARGDFVLVVRGFHGDPRISAPSVTAVML